ncbi:hypothetical protein CANARDRAFT_109229 [[Candida] arabinofermentans NRRL YB-2248]|uniref:Uncharacterized protein n=1 Tax=[Candida] arabinofermentans NRRL YB-2248 TaxID=983967 RepID=A0A1E4STF4_9ASCO|nr:hypothetical protein CANARDRAFT_109229 [[Candida] arabinofermentans NRRL YB-2248]
MVQNERRGNHYGTTAATAQQQQQQQQQQQRQMQAQAQVQAQAIPNQHHHHHQHQQQEQQKQPQNIQAQFHSSGQQQSSSSNVGPPQPQQIHVRHSSLSFPVSATGPVATATDPANYQNIEEQAARTLSSMNETTDESTETRKRSITNDTERLVDRLTTPPISPKSSSFKKLKLKKSPTNGNGHSPSTSANSLWPSNDSWFTAGKFSTPTAAAARHDNFTATRITYEQPTTSSCGRCSSTAYPSHEHGRK